jgi:hypothetical protein
MKTKVDNMTVKKLLELNDSNSLNIDDEYQRAEVWSLDQKKRFIDSILRGFPIPMMILSKPNSEVEKYDIIDGQQRRVAIRDFYTRNDFNLYDVQNPKNKFPDYLRVLSCEWGNKNFHNLSKENKDSFLNHNLPVWIIEDTIEDDVLRDIFVRLQSGAPLNSQEKRDAMPGEFSGFVRKIGGKGNDEGDAFFEEFARRSAKSDRGKVRELVAKLFLLFLESETNARFVDIGTKNIDQIYYEYINMTEIEIYKDRFIEILDELYKILDFKFKLENYEIIHLFLFAKECKNLELDKWQDLIKPAFLKFREHLNQGKNNEKSPYKTEFLDKRRVSSDKVNSIRERHNFFSYNMLSFMYNDDGIKSNLSIEQNIYIQKHSNIEDYQNLIELGENLNIEAIIRFFVPNLPINPILIERLEVLKEKLKIDITAKEHLDKAGIVSDSINSNIESLKEEIRRIENGTQQIRILNQNQQQEVYRLTSITATKKDGTVHKANTFTSLIPSIYPAIFGDGKARNYPGLILGTDMGLKIFEQFWDDFESVEFLMRNRQYIVKRNDFGTFWTKRFSNIG